MPAPRLSVAVLPHAGRGAARLQLEPLRRSARALRRRGLDVRYGGPPGDADVVAVQFDWAAPVGDVLARLGELRRAMAGGSRLVFLDYYDSTASPHAAAVEVCDVHLRCHLPADVADLAAAPGTGGRFARRVAEAVGSDVPDGRDEAVAQVVRRHADRLRLGWNFAAADFARRLLLAPPARLGRPRKVASWAGRTTDLHCVSGVGVPGYDDWYHRHRAAAVAAAASLEGRISVVHRGVLADQSNAMPPRAYGRTLRASRLCLSPLGYGELCYRDFEAVAAGCVLVKPDVGGLRTDPDVFEAGVTYLPCRWDFADLAEVVADALADPARSAAIAAAARRRLLDYHARRGWLDAFERAVREPDV